MRVFSGAMPAACRTAALRVVRQKKIIGAALVPDRVHGKRIGDDDDAFAAGVSDRPEHLVEHVGVGGINGDDDVGLEAAEEAAEMFLEREEDAEVAGEFLPAIEPAINAAPGLRPLVDQAEIDLARPSVGRAVGFGEEIVHLDAHLASGDLEQALANAAGGAVVTFAEGGGQDQNFFQNSLGSAFAKRYGAAGPLFTFAGARFAGSGVREFNGYLWRGKVNSARR